VITSDKSDNSEPSAERGAADLPQLVQPLEGDELHVKGRALALHKHTAQAHNPMR
jgi:hypothetical protein